ncbi:MAG: hypothetical protein A3E01_02500 [Gammaproteobacteria bacterium RIFCSPHIGHO2_12_FULL_63_22]|nr:MAG: hypothetical protein A3E01_02500 [Gammaproteobacteria bacterium RIFCSPHIGHO2_12_FULL_63_22]
MALSSIFPGLAAAGEVRNAGEFDRFIIKFKVGSPEFREANARQRLLDASAAPQRLIAKPMFRMGIGADVVKLDRKLRHPAAQAFMNRLRRNASVEYVEIDRRMRPALVPNDTYYSGYQWHLYETAGGINAPLAWDKADGFGVFVAVIDTGRTIHSEITESPGYDFISDVATANDGNGRDADPIDAGDWAAAGDCGAGEPATDSSWHGTQVAGIIGAMTNNAKGIAGVAYRTRILPLRVLGKCGGNTSDTVDAIRWAAGGSVPGVPNNATPVEVINLSLSSPASCGPSMQAAINEAVAAGIVVVVAAGNGNADASTFQPANCANVVTVGATLRSGARAPYSNHGPSVDLSAPGGGPGGYVVTTSNFGTTVRGAEGYVYTLGSSLSAPHVAGTVALMQSKQVNTPGAVEAMLKATARPFPEACSPGCGTGIVNAAAALGAAMGGALSIDDAVVGEGSVNSPAVLTFTVRLSKPMPSAVDFDVATSNGSAGFEDFNGIYKPGMSIAAGETSKQFTISIMGDSIPEEDEVFTISVSNVSGIAVADASAEGRIINDDPVALENEVPATAGVKTYIGLKMLVGGQYALYSLYVPPGTTTLNFKLRSGYSSGDVDLYVKRGSLPTLSLADCISANVDSTELCTFENPEPGMYYALVHAYLDTYEANITGTFAPKVPAIGVSDTASIEDSERIFFAVRLTEPATRDVTFKLSTDSGTAIGGEDFVAIDNVEARIPAGSKELLVEVPLINDTQAELTEFFALYISDVQGALLAGDRGSAKVGDDDYPRLKLSNVDIVEGNAGISTARFVIELSRPTSRQVTFDIATGSGTAIADSDFVTRSLNRHAIDPGRTRQVFEVSIIGDTVAEADEWFWVRLANVFGAQPEDYGVQAVIVNDDAAAAKARRGVNPARKTAPARAEARKVRP